MKHTIKISLIIIAMFLIAQFIGLAVIDSLNKYREIKEEYTKIKEEALEKGLTPPPSPEIPVIEHTVPPKIELKQPIDVAKIITSIVIAILIATALFFLLSRIRTIILLRVWFAFVVFVCLSISFCLLLYRGVGWDRTLTAAVWITALFLAGILTFYKIVKRNVLVHNFTELFIYPGLAVIFLPLLNWIAAAFLLIAISIYDMWAVWKTKYMIKLAKFQIKQMKIFTGFFVPYLRPKEKVKLERLTMARAMAKEKRTKKIKVRVELAALGGGDIAFPLIFAGTILLAFGLAASIITILCTTAALTLLLVFSKKGKAYPAMPFLSAGCFLGLALVLLF